MKHHETRLERDSAEIQDSVARMAQGVREAIDEAVHGLLARDHSRMYRVMLDDHPYNRMMRANDRACHAFVARHLPAAGHLRWVSSVLRLNIGLERIGDYAVTICRVGVQLESDLPPAIQDDIRALADQASRMLELATRAFLKRDADLAKQTAKLAKTVDLAHDRVFAKLVAHASQFPLMDVIRLQTIYDKLERVSDQAKNLCEEAVFVTTGETKQPKVYKVLFLERAHNNWGHLAEHMARKAFPGSGAYDSAGWAPASTLAPSLLPQAEQLGLELGDAQPQSVDDLFHPLADYHVIVCLGDSEGCPEIPFYTSLLKWTLPEDTQQATRELSAHIADLMQLMRGDDAP